MHQSRLRIAAAIVPAVGVLGAPALAQPYIEIRVHEHTDYTASTHFPQHRIGRYVFDVGVGPTVHGFIAVDGEWGYVENFDASPFAPLPEMTPGGAVLNTTSQAGGAFSMSGDPEIYLSVQGLPAFFTGMGALPADPAAYGPGTAIFGEEVTWTDGPFSSFSGGSLSYSVAIVDEPAALRCVADLDGNGVLNVDDIDFFVNSFLNGCP